MLGPRAFLIYTLRLVFTWSFCFFFLFYYSLEMEDDVQAESQGWCGCRIIPSAVPELLVCVFVLNSSTVFYCRSINEKRRSLEIATFVSIYGFAFLMIYLPTSRLLLSLVQELDALCLTTFYRLSQA